MINLRYHIVSITAVFLALGIGVALGSTLIERATVDTLSGRLDEQSERLDRTDGENADLRDQLDQVAEREAQLTAQRGSLYVGHLTDVPTVVLTVQGTDDDLVALTSESLRAAGADLHGVLRLTSRWESLSQDEVADLAGLLGRTLVRGPETRQAALEALAEELLVASGPFPVEAEEPVSPDDPDAPPPPEDPASTTTLPDEIDPADVVIPETPIVDGLIERGYLEFAADGSSDPLPSFDARYVMVLDDSTDVGVADVVVPLVELLATADPAPLVVAETLAPVVDDERPEPPLAGPVVTAVRADESLSSALSTADSPRDFVGQSALVLALADLVGDQPRVGQYGVAVGATSLWPTLEE
jgi:hypothetical protein